MEPLVSFLRLRARYPERPELREFPFLSFPVSFSAGGSSTELLAPKEKAIVRHESGASRLMQEFLSFAQPEQHRSLATSQQLLQALRGSLEEADFSRPGPFRQELDLLYRLLNDLIRIHRIYGTCLLAVLEGVFSAPDAEGTTTLEYLELQDLSSLTERFVEGLRLGMRFLDNMVCYEPLPGMPLIDKGLESDILRALYRLQDLQHRSRNFQVLLKRMQDDWLELERQAFQN